MASIFTDIHQQSSGNQMDGHQWQVLTILNMAYKFAKLYTVYT